MLLDSLAGVHFSDALTTQFYLMSGVDDPVKDGVSYCLAMVLG